MPRLKESTKKAKAQTLLKLASECNFNEHEMARRLGVSHQSVHEQLNKDYVQEVFKESFDRYLPDCRLARKLSVLLDATRTVYVKGKPKEVDDHSAQLKALELAMKYKGYFGNDGEEKTPQYITAIINSFNRNGQKRLSADDKRNISQVRSNIAEVLRSRQSVSVD